MGSIVVVPTIVPQRQVAIRKPEASALIRYREPLADVAVIVPGVTENTTEYLINPSSPRNHSTQEVIPEIGLYSHEVVTLDENILHMRSNNVQSWPKFRVPDFPHLKGRSRTPVVTDGGQ